MNKIYKIGCLVLAVIWFKLAVTSSIAGMCGKEDSLLNIFRQYAFKSEIDRIKIVEPQRSPTIALIDSKVPQYEKLLILSSPFGRYYPLEYYAFPRQLFWYDLKTTDIKDQLRFCYMANFNYCLSYDQAGNPFIMKVR